jgi:cellulose synthase/poly-beta-1,6-N-acetylglucosamine synthase-like glycosyltransferase
MQAAAFGAASSFAHDGIEDQVFRDINAKISQCLGGADIDPTTNREFRYAFHGDRPDEETKRFIAVCVPMYNENKEELMQTMKDLELMQLQFRDLDLRFKVAIIQDGWEKVHPTVKKMLSRCHGTGNHEDFSAWTLEMDRMCKAQHKLTVILPETQYERVDLDTTVILKLDNRKKHNSHDLFFRGFAARYHTKYAFATDCGTKFDPDCLRYLYDLMERDPRCIAATGRQRVMSKWDQPGCEVEGFWGSFLRAVQGYDYEASTVVYNSCFSLFGCLPVVPGPCGLFRLAPLLEDPSNARRSSDLSTVDNDTSPFGFYAAAAKRAAENKDMLDGNTLLAEDRVLTYAAEFLTKDDCCKVKWEKRAIFYFQAELELRSLVAQRRRWLNGTIASYVYVVNQLGSHFSPNNQLTLGTKLKYRFLQFFNCLMLGIYAGIAIGPAMYIYIFTKSMRNLVQDDSQHESYIIGVVMFAIYLLFQWRHHFVPFDMLVFAGVTVTNAVAALVTIFEFFRSNFEEVSWCHYVGYFNIFLPIVLNMMIPDFYSLTTLLNPFNWLSYMAFMPTMQGYFLSLAVARTYDLSWGNRDGIGQAEEGLRQSSAAFIVIQNILNFAVLILTFHFDSKMEKVTQIVLAVAACLPIVLISLFSVLQAFGKAIVAVCILAMPVIWLHCRPAHTFVNTFEEMFNNPYMPQFFMKDSKILYFDLLCLLAFILACKAITVQIYLAISRSRYPRLREDCGDYGTA